MHYFKLLGFILVALITGARAQFDPSGESWCTIYGLSTDGKKPKVLHYDVGKEKMTMVSITSWSRNEQWFFCTNRATNVLNISSVAQDAQGYFVLLRGVAQEGDGMPVEIAQRPASERVMWWNVTSSDDINGSSVFITLSRNGYQPLLTWSDDPPGCTINGGGISDNGSGKGPGVAELRQQRWRLVSIEEDVQNATYLLDFVNGIKNSKGNQSLHDQYQEQYNKYKTLYSTWFASDQSRDYLPNRG